jgi:hypothetical protein
MKRAWVVFLILFLIPLSAQGQELPSQSPIGEQRPPITPQQLEQLKEYKLKLEDQLIEDETFARLKRELDSLQNRTTQPEVGALNLQLSKDDKAKIRESLERSEENLKYLQFKSKVKDVPQEYLDTLDATAEQLSSLKVKGTLSKEDYNTLKTLEADLDVKANSAQQCMTEPFSKYGVKAQTKKGSTEVGGFEVWYVPKGDPDNARKYECLKGCAHSSPVDGEAVAGIYYFWAQNPQNSQNKGERRPHTVECNGAKEITLPAP